MSFFAFFFFRPSSASPLAVTAESEGAGEREDKRKDEVALESSLWHDGQTGLEDEEGPDDGG